MYIPIAIALIGLVAILVERAAAKANAAELRVRSATVSGLLLLFRVSLAVTSMGATYPYGAEFRVVGIPFLAAMWVQDGAHRRFGVAWWSMLAVIGNAYVAYRLPDLIIAVNRWRRQRRG